MIMNKSKSEQEAGIFPLGEPAADFYSGTVHVQPLVTPEEVEKLYTVGQTTYEPGGRTYWHTHPVGQVLLITAGRGHYQERGKAARPICKGDVVVIPRDVEHWHGADKDSWLVYIAISNIFGGTNVDWVKPVSEREYEDAASKMKKSAEAPLP